MTRTNLPQADTNTDLRLLSKQECERIVQRIASYESGGGETRVMITAWWNGELRWARNRTSVAGDRRDLQIVIDRKVDRGRVGRMKTNQVDDTSLRAAVHAAERVSQMYRAVAPQDLSVASPPLPQPQTAIWSDNTFAVTAQQRARLAQSLSEEAELKQMLSAGYLEMRAGEWASASTRDMVVEYKQLTHAQCSMTVRHPKGVGAGWAGLSSYDWAAIDGVTLARRALEKCVASIDPVRIEPGRYTVVLEPQAVCDLLSPMMKTLARPGIEISGNRQTPWMLGRDAALGIWRTKLGLKVADDRVTIMHDPADSQLGVVPKPALRPIVWIKNGVLTTMEHTTRPEDRIGYTLPYLNDNLPDLFRPAFRMDGGGSSVSTMIETTTRGLLVTRFSGVDVLDRGSVLLTGTTRDGLWLIENGKITKTVKNMRITESPLFVLNQIQELGPAEPVFRPVRNPDVFMTTPAIVPPIKANDFSFTSLIDAV